MIYPDKDPTFRTLLVQEALAARGLYTGEVDNDDGPKTRAAYREFLDGMNIEPTVMQLNVPKGAERTDWRGYRPISASALSPLLPASARPLVGSFIKWAQHFNLNPLFLVAISRHETGAWTSRVFREKNNAMGISDKKGAIRCPSYDQSIYKAAFSLGRPKGLYSGAKTLADVGSIYAPVGAANDPTKVNHYWPSLVAKYMAEYEAQLS